MKDQNSQTLFRFVSLRNPELTAAEQKQARFIFVSNTAKDSTFYDSVIGRSEGVSKWEALQTAVADYRAATRAEIEAVDRNLFEFSEWLAKNRSTATIYEIEEKTLGIDVVTNDALLWDNLFYQFASEADFYLKEVIIHMIKANHVIANFPRGEELDGETKKALVNDILFATVVLPSELFDFSEETPTNPENQTETISVIPLSKKLKAEVAGQELQQLEKAIDEVEDLQESYTKEYQNAYETAKKSHDQNVKVILDEYETDLQQAKDNWCTTRGDKAYDVNNINPCDQPARVPYPEIPEFSFTFRDEIDSKEARALFSEATYDTLTRIEPIERIKTFAKATEILHKEKSKVTAEVFDNTTFYRNSVSINGTILQVEQQTEPNKPTVAFCSRRRINPKTNMAYWGFFADINNPTQEVSFAVQAVNVEIFDVSDNLLHTSNSFLVLSQTMSAIRINFLTDVLTVPTAPHANLRLKATITMMDGSIHSHDNIIQPNTCNLATVATSNSNEENRTYIPLGYGFRQLGIADYRKVEQSVHCYVEGEVSHIENVMAREYKEKTTRRLRSSENTTSTSSETEKERLTDTTTTDRYEMQNEVSQVIAEAQDFSANTSFNMGRQGDLYFNVGASTNFATHTSNEDSINQAMTEAQEVTERAMDRVVQRIKEERITKIIEEFEESNSHGFDNRKGDKHIVGVYRWVDKIYKNQIFNYGRRLMYEFAIPQPSKLHRLAMTADMSEEDTELSEPIDPRTVAIAGEIISDASKITANNYRKLAAVYNAEVSTIPDDTIQIGKAFKMTNQGEGNDAIDNAIAESIEIPENYYCNKAYVKGSFFRHADQDDSNTTITVGNAIDHIPSERTNYSKTFSFHTNQIENTLPVSVRTRDIDAMSLNVTADCFLKPQALEAWQLETFNTIITAYEDKLAEYRSLKSQEEEKVETLKSSNPMFYRQIEQTVLRKNCLSYLMDQTPTAANTFGKKMYGGSEFTDHQVHVTENMNNYVSFAQFLEQAFEWEIMSYYFYPFYWGNRDEWSKLYTYENNDPLFRSFMQAGLARVVLTVRPGFEEAVMHYMATGSVWNGGELPVLEDPLYISIANEMKKPIGVKEGKAWKTKVPTSLTILQADSLGLKVEKALPCECEDIADFIEADQTPCSSEIVNEPTVFENLQVGDSDTSSTQPAS